jgi:squalene-hopene/tetraprenyl-beta-curcumene cyclase
MQLDRNALRETLIAAREALVAERTSTGIWEGELSASALSTATALFALEMLDRQPAAHESATNVANRRKLVADGIRWLLEKQNADGGWGDTELSFSNISTTALCWATLCFVQAGPNSPSGALQLAIDRAADWLHRAAGATLEPEPLAKAIADRYGRDRTFSVPILTVLALAGCLRTEPAAWKLVPQLPFELAACPRTWFRWLRLPVVSYALPALIALGQLRHQRRPSWNWLARGIRRLTLGRSLDVLTAIQPTTGGFLEATPLTSFVVISLLGAGRTDHPVVKHGIDFLIRSAQSDGSWPIDTNLATWVTTLSIQALAKSGDRSPRLTDGEAAKVCDWLLGQQYRKRHPYTDAAPGGWAWTDLSGGVPDADDTPGALLALHSLAGDEPRIVEAAAAGARWLLDLQNRDGGMPTFCRGWGKLPFDRSSADLTAHAVLAWSAWCKKFPAALGRRIERGIERALRYLCRVQRDDGAWAPLWFGNQHAPHDENLAYGTSRVLRLAQLLELNQIGGPDWISAVQRAAHWLLGAQNTDGGWGGAIAAPSSIEETALALESLAAIQHRAGVDVESVSWAVARGVDWLAEATDRGRQFPPTPIGFYFAKLWYFERLYPLIYTVAALGAVEDAFAPNAADCETARTASCSGISTVLPHPHPSPLPSRERGNDASHRSS